MGKNVTPTQQLSLTWVVSGLNSGHQAVFKTQGFLSGQVNPTFTLGISVTAPSSFFLNEGAEMILKGKAEGREERKEEEGRGERRKRFLSFVSFL